MRVPTDDRPRRRIGARVWIIGAIVAALVLLASLRGVARFYTDYLWFDEVGFSGVWSGLIAAKLVPALVFTGFFFALMFANLVIADRLAPRYRAMGPEDEMIERYRQAAAPYAGRIRVGISLFFALVAGAGVSSRWREWLLFRNRVDFGVKDPQFHKDVGFYVFQLPFIKFALEWTFVSLIVVLIVVAVFHYINGGIRIQSPYQRVTPQVKAHLSVILALMSLVKTAQYFFNRYELNFSSRGAIDGASYTDVHAQLPALNLLMIISVFAAGLFIANIWRRGWVLPIIAVGLWGLIALIVGTIYPQYIQRFQVRPNEFAREEDYIDRNIDATRAAFKLDQVKTRSFPYTEAPAREFAPTVEENTATLENARLWDPEQIAQSYQQLQEFRPFYEFVDVDIDRYTVGSKSVPSLISVRELNPSRLPSSTWTNSHLVYTHGYAAVMASAIDVAQNSTPDFLLSDIPPQGTVKITQPGIYYGENVSDFAIVNTKQGEIRPAEADSQDVRVNYDGTGGIQTSSWLRRAALALRFGDVNPLISGQITPKSRAIFYRDIRQRAEKAAPFLQYDSDPYPVILDGKVIWVLDAYTTSSKYPYSQSINPHGVPGNSGLASEFNYVRNSVKVTIDSYDGTLHYYVIDSSDPMVRAWQKAFPDLFEDKRDLPAGLEEHFRFPSDLFKAQSEQFAIYHMTDPQLFYNKADIWDVAPQPTTDVNTASDASAPGTTQGGSNGGRNETLEGTLRPSEPLYLTMQLPDDQNPDQQFVMMRPFVPRSKNNQLSAFMVAKSDPGVYGDLVVYTTPTTREAPSPTKVANQIESDPAISRQFTLLDDRGSQVIRGQVQLIPVGDSIIYVRPIYVQGTGENSFPRFKYLAVSYGEQSVLAANIEDGINQIFKGAAPQVTLENNDGTTTGGSETEPGGGPTTTPTSLPDNIDELIRRADQALAEAQTALEGGDLGTYQKKVDEAETYIDEANRLAGATPSSTAPSSSTPTTAPSTPTSRAPAAATTSTTTLPEV